jgi:hypothetical protein
MAKTKVHGEYLQDSVVRFTAKAGENITKGQPVYISGISGELPVVSLADADDTAKMPAFGLAEATVSTNAEVEVTSFGTLAGLDTSTPGYSLGDILYVDTTAGALTNDPAGLEATKLQNIGIVQRVHASNGSIKVGGAGRTNAVPNLNDGDIFIGDANNKAVSSSLTTEIESYLDGGTSTPTFSTATVTGDLTVDTNTLYVDSTNNRVGVGCTPYFNFDVQLNSSRRIGFNYSDSQNTILSHDGSGNIETLGLRGNTLIFYSDYDVSNPDGVQRMIIDSSGNVMVNTDNTLPADNNVEGISLTTYNGGLIQVSRSSQPALTVNRISTDGSVALFKKDGSTVGSISSNSGNTSYNSNGGVIYLGGDQTNHIKVLTSTASGQARIEPSADNAVNLGQSGLRFKDLYLSGGVVFGSTGGNVTSKTLDDYEEGTFTPQVGDGTMTFAFVRGHYVKIGRLVHIHIGFRLNGASPTGSDAYISGLPFASETTGSYQEPHARCAVAGNLYNATPDLSFYLSSGSSVLYARDSSTNADTAVASNSIWTSTSFIKLQMCYRTS